MRFKIMKDNGLYYLWKKVGIFGWWPVMKDSELLIDGLESGRDHICFATLQEVEHYIESLSPNKKVVREFNIRLR